MKSTASSLDSKSTFELAFRLLDDISTEEKFSILQIIRGRDNGGSYESATTAAPQKKRGRKPGAAAAAPEAAPKAGRGRAAGKKGRGRKAGGGSGRPPLKGSKAEKILDAYKSGVTSAREIKEMLQQKKVNATPPEIYRVIKKYAGA